jgi:hypothetical protein
LMVPIGSWVLRPAGQFYSLKCILIVSARVEQICYSLGIASSGLVIQKTGLVHFARRFLFELAC